MSQALRKFYVSTSFANRSIELREYDDDSLTEKWSVKGGAKETDFLRALVKDVRDRLNDGRENLLELRNKHPHLVSNAYQKLWK